MIDIINFLTAFLVGLSNILFSLMILNSFISKKSFSQLLQLLFFLILGTGWILVSLSINSFTNSETFYGELFIKLGIGLISLNSVIQMLLATYLLSPKNIKYAILIGSLVTVGIIYTVIMYPIDYYNTDFVYHSNLRIAIFSAIFINLIASGMFINFSRKSKNKIIARKTLFFGIGLLITILGTIGAALIETFFITQIFRLSIIAGVSIFYLGSIIKE